MKKKRWLLASMLFLLVMVAAGCSAPEGNVQNGIDVEEEKNVNDSGKENGYEKEGLNEKNLEGINDSEFAREKELTVIKEGMEETRNFYLHQSDLGYLIYVDEAFSVEPEEKGDRYVRENFGNLPEIFMEIRLVENTTPEEKATVLQEEWEEKYREDYQSVDYRGKVEEPLECYQIIWEELPRPYGSTDYGSLVSSYVAENESGQGVLVISLHYFGDAADGMEPVFEAMLNSLSWDL